MWFKDEFYAVLSGAQREIRHFFVEGGSFYLTRPLLLGEAPPPLLNPPLLRRKDLKPGRPGLYEQTSSRPKGLLVEFDAIKLRLFDAT